MLASINPEPKKTRKGSKSVFLDTLIAVSFSDEKYTATMANKMPKTFKKDSDSLYKSTPITTGITKDILVATEATATPTC